MRFCEESAVPAITALSSRVGCTLGTYAARRAWHEHTTSSLNMRKGTGGEKTKCVRQKDSHAQLLLCTLRASPGWMPGDR
eukprot:3125413-Prymnesium_polylepis.1